MAFIIIGSFLVITGFVIGWILADNHLFWKRQDWASRAERF